MSNSPFQIKRIGLILGPLLFLIIISIQGSALSITAWKVLALATWMIVWWITEAIPIPATALLPLVMFPYLEIFTITEAASNYANSIIFLFMGGFIIALGLERHNLHQRIALNLIKITGTQANGIILGFMLATAVLSMWISNTATAVMMLPIASSVVAILEKQQLNRAGNPEGFKKFALALFLSIAYSANIGGIATIIGTPPNVVFVGYIKEFYNHEMDFISWFIIGLPTVILLISITYWLLTRVLFKNRMGSIEGAAEVIDSKLKSLGVFSKEEKWVSTVFLLTAFAWIFKNPINHLIGTPLLNDTVTAMTGGVLMFVIPTDWKKGVNLLDWEDMKRLPWGILILFGGGICLAKGMEETGLIQLIGESVASRPEIKGWLLIGVLTAVMLFMTELMSNVALTAIFIPVVFGIASGTDIDPLVLSIPIAMASSCAFMMPISTPPNAIVFASGHIKVKDMMRAGLLLNIISVILLLILSLTLFSSIMTGKVG